MFETAGLQNIKKSKIDRFKAKNIFLSTTKIQMEKKLFDHMLAKFSIFFNSGYLSIFIVTYFKMLLKFDFHLYQ